MATIEHGTLTAAKRGCSCDPCLAASNRYENRRRRLIAYGQWQPLVDIGPVRDHIHKLKAAGIGVDRIAEISGIYSSDICRFIRSGPGQPRRIRPDRAAAILAIEPSMDAAAPSALIDISGTHRRIQALCCLGWSISAQARLLNRDPRTHFTVLQQRYVTGRLARDIRDLYDRLSSTPAPASQSTTATRRMAERKGWLPPAAWDDDLIDLPEDQLATELARLVALMDDDELRHCHNAYYRHGDKTPLTTAGALEHRRRKYSTSKAA